MISHPIGKTGRVFHVLGEGEQMPPPRAGDVVWSSASRSFWVATDGGWRDVTGFLAQLARRVGELEQQENRAAQVDALPDTAPFGALIRLRGDLTGALYLGNGPNRPLTKLTPAAL